MHTLKSQFENASQINIKLCSIIKMNDLFYNVILFSFFIYNDLY